MKTPLFKQVALLLKKIPPPKNQKFSAESYVGGGKSKLQYLNLKIPKVRNLLKSPPLKTATWKEIQNLWKNSKTFEGKSLALFWLEKQSLEFLKAEVNTYSTWAYNVDNWAHSDGLCGLLAKVYEEDPTLLHLKYKEWNQSSNPWLRRISMVGLLYYSRLRKKTPSFRILIEFINKNFNDSDYYVQKGLGWTLREIYGVYPKETVSFIKTHLHEIHPHAWHATSEKLPLTLKKELVLKRRNKRIKD